MAKIKKILALFLVFLLLFTSAPFNGRAENENKLTKVEEATPATYLLPKGEIIKERTANSKVFYNGDGTFTKKIYFQPIHKKNKEKGEWEDLSSKLTDSSDDKTVNTENAILNSSFYKHMKNGEYANFDYNGHAVSYSLLEASGDTSKVPIDDATATYTKKSHQILYKNVFPDIDLRNITFDQNIKEDLVLHSYMGYNTFKFHLTTDLEAEIQKDGSIDFKIKDTNEKVFNLPKPFMSDSNYDEHSGEVARSGDVKYDLEKVDDGYNLTIKADESWIKDPNRVYPIYIDPSTSITTSTDAFVMSAYPTTNYGTSSDK